MAKPVAVEIPAHNAVDRIGVRLLDNPLRATAKRVGASRLAVSLEMLGAALLTIVAVLGAGAGPIAVLVVALVCMFGISRVLTVARLHRAWAGTITRSRIREDRIRRATRATQDFNDQRWLLLVSVPIVAASVLWLGFNALAAVALVSLVFLTAGAYVSPAIGGRGKPQLVIL